MADGRVCAQVEMIAASIIIIIIINIIIIIINNIFWEEIITYVPLIRHEPN
jgi:hypothetical protein